MYALRESGLTAVLDGMAGDARRPGSEMAVDEFAARHADRFVLQVMPHDLGLFILRPRS